MARIPRALLLGLLLGLTLHGCAESGRGPTSPSSAQLPTPTLNWECGRQLEIAAAGASGWSFSAAPSSCPAVRAFAQDVGIGLVSLAPANLRSTITGTSVRLDWDTIPEVVTSFLVEAGSATTLANLAVLNTGSSATSLSVDNVPFGVYFVRVRGIGPDGIPGPPSNEIIVRVGGPCSAAPGAPRTLARVVVGNQVNLQWQPPASGDPPASYNIEAGSAPTLSNIIVFNTGNSATVLSASAPNGLYFVRVRGVNACGTSVGSNEVAVGVNVAEPPLDPPTSPQPPAPPPTPPTSPLPPPTGPAPPPPVVVTEASVPVAVVTITRGTRPDAGAGPVLGPPTTAPAPSPGSTQVTLSATASFDTVIVSADTAAADDRLHAAVVAPTFTTIRLVSPTTNLALIIATPPAGTAPQFAVRLGTGLVGNYVTVPATTVVVRSAALLAEDFEDGVLDPKISVQTTGAFGAGPGIRNLSNFGSARAFGFGRSVCGASCFFAFETTLRITFPLAELVANISFKEMELFSNWGSGGGIFLDGQPFGPVCVLPACGQYTDFGRVPVNDFRADSVFRTKSFTVNRIVRTIELRVNDISNLSEIYIDDLVIAGPTGQPLLSRPRD